MGCTWSQDQSSHGTATAIPSRTSQEVSVRLLPEFKDISKETQAAVTPVKEVLSGRSTYATPASGTSQPLYASPDASGTLSSPTVHPRSKSSRSAAGGLQETTDAASPARTPFSSEMAPASALPLELSQSSSSSLQAGESRSSTYPESPAHMFALRSEFAHKAAPQSDPVRTHSLLRRWCQALSANRLKLPKQALSGCCQLRNMS